LCRVSDAQTNCADVDGPWVRPLADDGVLGICMPGMDVPGAIRMPDGIDRPDAAKL
jgi:hypothetical protein